VGVLLRLGDRLLGDPENLATGVVVALRQLDDLLVAATGHHTTLHSCHGSVLLRDRAACGPDGPRPRHEHGSSAAGCASAWSPSWCGCGYGWRGRPCTCRKRSSGSAWRPPDWS